MLEAAAGDLGYAVCVSAQDEGAVNVAASCACFARINRAVRRKRGNSGLDGESGVARCACGSRNDLVCAAGKQDRTACKSSSLACADCLRNSHGGGAGGNGGLDGEVAGSCGQSGSVEHLCLAGLYEAHALDLADLALIDAVRIGIGLDVHPLRIAHKVISGIGVDDTHEVAVDLLRVLDFQGADCLANLVNGEVVVVCCGIAAADKGAAVKHTACIEDVGAAVEDFAGDGIQRAASLGGKQLGGFHQVVVNGGEEQDIGKLDEAAVLLHSRIDHAHI